MHRCHNRHRHYFKVRPHVGLEIPQMKCIREPDNIYDPQAIEVVTPKLSEIHEDDHDYVVKENQLIRDIVGKIVGRVPIDMAQVLSLRIDDGTI